MLFWNNAEMRRFSHFLEKPQMKEVSRLLRQKKAGVYIAVTKAGIADQVAFPQLNPLVHDLSVVEYIKDINDCIAERAHEHWFYSFAPRSEDVLSSLVGRGISVFGDIDALRSAVLLQLVAKDPLHILVLTDDRAVEDALLENVLALSPRVSVYRGESLIMEKKSGQLIPGLLPKSDDGLFVIPELNHEKKIKPILAAMDSGVVPYKTKGVETSMQARVNVLAFAMPRGMKLLTGSLDVLKRQLPCDESLLSRFHLVFVIEEKKKRMFSQRVNEEDILMAKKYISFARMNQVKFEQRFASTVGKFMEFIRNDAHFFVVPVTGRIAEAVERLACARAMLHLRDVVLDEDVKAALGIVRESLYRVG